MTSTVLNIAAGQVRFRVLMSLYQCRAHRARPESLFACLPDMPHSTSRLHNACTSLFRYHLVQKAAGFYQLTSDGVAFAQGRSGA